MLGFEVSTPADFVGHYALIASKAYPDILTEVGGNAATALDVWNDYQAIIQKLQSLAQSQGIALPTTAAPVGPPA